MALKGPALAYHLALPGWTFPGVFTYGNASSSGCQSQPERPARTSDAAIAFSNERRATPSSAGARAGCSAPRMRARSALPVTDIAVDESGWIDAIRLHDRFAEAGMLLRVAVPVGPVHPRHLIGRP